MEKHKKPFPAQAEKMKKADYSTLCETIRYHNHLYYTNDNPEIHDAEYDALMALLIETEKLHPQWINSNSPTQTVGGEVKEELTKVNHQPPMMSLDNAMNLAEFSEFHERIRKAGLNDIRYHVEPKFDGLAIELVYESGNLVIGSTRGDGETGEDVTHNIRTVQNVPVKISHKNLPRKVSIRGEVLITKQDFEIVNQELQSEGKKLFANPRNAAAGSLRQLDSRITKKRRLRFFPYTVLDISAGKISGTFLPETQSQIWNSLLPKLGFEISDISFICRHEEISQIYEKFIVERSNLPYDLDGLVIKLNFTSEWENFGSTSRAPRWAIALKFPARSGITRMRKILFQVGRTGVITPVAVLEPVNIGGVMVGRASLHNADEIERLGLCENDLVEVARAGDVIPKVTNVIQEKREPLAKPIKFIEKCPSCGSLLKKEDVYYRCVNKTCKGKAIAFLQYFVSKSGLDIEYLGDEWITRLYEKKIITDMADIFLLNESHLENLEGMGDILRSKLLSSINDRRNCSFSIFLQALGIANVGPHIADILAENFSSLEELATANTEKLTAIHEIGPGIALSVADYFSSPDNQAILKKLLSTGFTITYHKREKKSNLLNGMTLVFTGTLSTMTREEAESLVKSHGGRASSSVSKKTNYVVAGKEAGSKAEKAKAMGVTIISEEEFKKLL